MLSILKKLILISLLFLASISFAQEKKCRDFKTGKFRYFQKDRPELILRTDSTQIEINSKTKVEVHSKIEWSSDCSYTMTYVKILNYPREWKHLIGQKILVDIISINKNGYKARARSPRMNMVIEFVRVK